MFPAETSPLSLAASPLPFGKDIEVFFDGLCPLCRREIEMLRRLDRRRRVIFTDITSPEFDANAVGIPPDQLMAEIHGRDRHGRTIKGMEVFRQLYTAVGYGWLVNVTKLPGLRHLSDAAYALFAKNRLRLTGRCNDRGCSLPDSESH